MQIFKKAETFRQQTGNLELIVNIFNHMLATLLEVERPLVQTKLDNIDKVGPFFFYIRYSIRSFPGLAKGSEASQLEEPLHFGLHPANNEHR